MNVDDVTKKLVDDGKIIEAGWLALKALTLRNGVSAQDETALRTAFYAGAQHLFGSIMSVLDPDDVPTEADLRRMDAINSELNAFAADFEAKYCGTEGLA